MPTLPFPRLALRWAKKIRVRTPQIGALPLKPRRASSGPLMNIRGRFQRTGWEEGMPVFKEDHIRQSLNCEWFHYYLEAAIAIE